MNSYASLLGSVQIQRGVGTSTNGDGAFGGSIALKTAVPSSMPSLELTTSYGSFNTLHAGAKASTGLLWNHLILDGAYNLTNTDGFIHGTEGKSGSYYGGATVLVNNNLIVSYKNIGNFEKTGQAWNGVTAGNNDLSIMDGTYGSKTGIKTYADMWDRGLGKFNSLYEAMNIADDGTITTERYKMADGSLWPKTTDNFWQNHNLLSLAWTANEHWSTTATIHYTYGYGYYEEFRPQNKLSKFGLVAADASGKNIKKTDFVRRKGLTQNTYGLVWNTSYKDERWDVIGGLAIQEFDGNHFGYVTYAANDDVKKKYLSNGRHKYYDSDAVKLDDSYFLKAAYALTAQWNIFGDLQYRHVDFHTGGINDKFYDDASGYYNQPLKINKKYDFFNPKAGLSWTSGAHHAYASVALSHREPERNNFTDNGKYPAPNAEQLLDYELGYTFSSPLFSAGANLYYMDYTDQFVQTGEVSDIGENLTTNIKDSYRMGIELQAAIRPTSWLTIEGNAALSQNKLKDFDEVVEDWDNGTTTIHYDDATLAFSPSLIANGFVDVHFCGLQATWHTGYVSRQYLDNTENKDRSLPAYSASDFTVNYTLKDSPLTSHLSLKEIVLGLNVNNVFDAHYAASGWVYSALYASGGHGNDNRYYQIGFIPMAGRSLMGSLTLRF
jgi:iron complex outermembrane receptor protein